jgi:hypothetical protein
MNSSAKEQAEILRQFGCGIGSVAIPATYTAEVAAALLAGSEALEAVQVAKAALLKVRDHARPTHREDAYEVCYDWCPLCAVTAALARLEGK